MNESKQGESTEKRPGWWKAEHDSSWDKVKASIVEDWKKIDAGASKLESAVADKALAFGHAARANWKKFEAWTDELEKSVAADWKQTEKNAGESWDKVKNAVKHGWERAKGSVSAAKS